MGKLSIGVLMTNYNSWDLATFGIRAHLDRAGHSIERILLVDDHSDEVYDEFIDPKVEIIRNEETIGYARNVNMGFSKLDTDIVLLFDADASPLMDYSEIVSRLFADDERLGIVGFTTYGKSNELTGSAEKEPGVLSLVVGQRIDGLYRRYIKKSRGADTVYSCCVAVRKSAFDDVGGLDVTFDWLDADHDLCMRMRERGWKVAHSSELKALHEGGGSPKLPSYRVFRSYKNRWYLLRKHGKIKNVFLIKKIILFRLRIEYLILLLFGRLIFKDQEVVQDKLTGRKKTILYCKENYR